MEAGASRRDLPRGPASVLRRVIGLGFAALAALSAPSCLGVLDLDGYAAVPQALCTELARCYGAESFAKCEGHVSSQLTAAASKDKQSYLDFFTHSSCLENCQSARKCLDVPPVCRATRESCTTVEQCCGFSLGTALCQRQSCCQAEGAECQSNVDCCVGNCINGTCGGTECLAPGEQCAIDAECCTGQCLADKTCSDAICDPDGFNCAMNEQCCSGVCQGNVCTTPSCAADNEPCLADADCCSPDGCDKQLGICGAGMCLPAGASCAYAGDKCCGGLVCKPGYWQCLDESSCTANGTNCSIDDECCSLHCEGTCQCVNDGQPCGESYSCCSRACINGQCGQCKQQGNACTTAGECCSEICATGMCCAQAGCDHDICTPGSPLHPKSCQNQSLAEAECIRAICEIDSVCCCGKWDEACVAQVAMVCSLKCP